jgi:hypothetical protein
VGGRIGVALIALVLAMVACAAPVEQPSPSPGQSVAAPSDSASPAAAQPTSPQPTASASPVVTPSPSPVPPATPTPSAVPVGGWIGPDRISTRDYDELSLVIDYDGIAHAAAVLNNGIFYLTNASGSWTRERVSTPLAGGADGQPSITYDPEQGYLAIAYTSFSRFDCFELGCFPAGSRGIDAVYNRAGSWSEPYSLTEDRSAHGVLRPGIDTAHLAFEHTLRGTTYVSHVIDEGLGMNFVGEGHSPSLQVGSDGLPRFAFIDEGVFFAQAEQPHSEYTIEPVAGVEGWPHLLLDDRDVPHLIYTSWDDRPAILHTARLDSTWSTPDLVVAGHYATAAAIDPAGAFHVIYDAFDSEDEADDGLWYVTNRDGSYRARQIDRSTRVLVDGPEASSALAVDRAGRPHFLYMVLLDESGDYNPSLYYAIGPGS